MKLNRNQLKYLAIVCMTVDHIAWIFVDQQYPLIGGIMHIFGRLTAPIMAFFISEGYEHTHDVNKYTLRLAVFAFISWAPFIYMEYGIPPIWYGDKGLYFNPMQSVIFTLLIGLISIRVYDSNLNGFIKALAIFALCLISCIGDWIFINVLACLALHVYKDKPKTKYILFGASYLPALAFNQWFQLGVFLAPPLLYFCYNGEPGSKKPFHKWFFYIYYPAHMVAIGMINALIS